MALTKLIGSRVRGGGRAGRWAALARRLGLALASALQLAQMGLRMETMPWEHFAQTCCPWQEAIHEVERFLSDGLWKGGFSW